MRICIPTRDDRGLAAEAFGRIGGSPYYTIADTVTGEMRVVGRGRNTGTCGHARPADAQECGPGARIRGLDVDTVVCADVGRRALSALERAGIAVFHSDGRTVEEILAEARGGLLRPATVEDACSGRGEHRCRPPSAAN